MSKVLIIDEKMNSVEVDITPQTLKMLGVKKEDVKHHKSRRQLNLEISLFIESLQLKE